MTISLAVRLHITRNIQLAARVLAFAAVATMAWATPPQKGPLDDEEAEARLLQYDLAVSGRKTAGSTPLDISEAGALRGKAAVNAKQLRRENIPAGPTTFGGPWTQLGPDPIVQGLRTPGPQRYGAMSGRIGALAIRPFNGRFILGAAQGGIWMYDVASGTWSPKTDDSTTQAIGALAIAPSNDAIMYAGTGEGALSGDSYFGDGVLKSTDGGNTWIKVSGDKFFHGVAMSRIVVDPTNPDHVYAAVLRGRGGARRVSPPGADTYGVWESKDGGVNWSLILNANKALGATDLEIDPQNPQVLYASVWGDAIYKTTDGGKKWSKAMNGLPAADYTAGPTRFSIAISRPSATVAATLYVGFDWTDADGYHPGRVFKSIDGAASWAILPGGADPEKVEDYCGSQCWYDNVVEVDPTDPNVVFVAGQFDYELGSGGIFRSNDGGQTWINLGYDQHPDFHAFAFNRNDTKKILIGSDGGVWSSDNRGGRPNGALDPLSAVDWFNLNGSVDPATRLVTHRTNLAIAQFTSIATVPQIPARFWGGTQDNGTARKSTASGSWFDVASGDGGQVLVDHTDDGTCEFGAFSGSCFIYGTYFGISPYRMADGGAFFFNNSSIRNGINANDRSDFYVPFAINRNNPSQLFLGTYRLYRTDNAKTANASDVAWKLISGDLTTGCAGTAPNGARNCTLSAIGVGGGDAVYVGSLDGVVYVSPNAQASDNPTWTRVSDSDLPKRPVAGFAVDRSNYRIAFAALNGFNGATPGKPGHVFRTRDGGKTWTDVSGNLPDAPVNSIVLDPSYPNVLYAGTDVGPFASYNGGTAWWPLGTGFPIVAIDQIDLDSYNRVIAAGTHGRGAYKSADTLAAPALVLTKVSDDGLPVGPGTRFTYTITLMNQGNADANGVTITDPLPANTTFVTADSGGTLAGGTVKWTGIAIPKGTGVTVHFTVDILSSVGKKVASIVNDGIVATTADGFFTTGSPVITPFADAYAVSVSPSTKTDGGKSGTSVPYILTIENDGFNADSYSLTATSAWTTTLFAADCTTPQTTVTGVAGGGSRDVCVMVAIPAGAANAAVNTGTVTVMSVGSVGLKATATLKTIAVAVDTLLVDGDGNAPDVQSYYTAALTGAGVAYSTWDLATDANLPRNFLLAFKNVVWYTGNGYPAPIGPYETLLTAFLDNGGRLLMSGQDILDQNGGTTAFVQNYLHIDWDGSEIQNDKATAHVNGVAGSPISNGIGAIPLDHSVLGATFEDQITPNGGALAAFTDDAAQTDALSYVGTYKVVFLAFPFEAYGNAAQRTQLMTNVFSFFGP